MRWITENNTLRERCQIPVYFRKLDPAAPEHLASEAVFIPHSLIDLNIAVFGIAQNRMSHSGQMAPELMGLACDQLHLQKRTAPAGDKGPVDRFSPVSAVFSAFREIDCIGHRVFFEVTLYLSGFADGSEDNCLIVFAKSPVPEKFSRFSCSRQRLRTDQYSSGVPVEAVADRIEPSIDAAVDDLKRKLRKLKTYFVDKKRKGGAIRYIVCDPIGKAQIMTKSFAEFRQIFGLED